MFFRHFHPLSAALSPPLGGIKGGYPAGSFLWPKEPALLAKAGSFRPKPASSGQSRLLLLAKGSRLLLAKAGSFCQKEAGFFWPKPASFGQKRPVGPLALE